MVVYHAVSTSEMLRLRTHNDVPSSKTANPSDSRLRLSPSLDSILELQSNLAHESRLEEGNLIDLDILFLFFFISPVAFLILVLVLPVRRRSISCPIPMTNMYV